MINRLLLLIALVSLYNLSMAQITFEHKYDSVAYDDQFTQDGIFLPVKLSENEMKYAEIDDNMIILYNLDHSVFKTMTIPLGNFNNEYVNYISSSLFDTDTSNVEYMVEGQDTSGVYGVYVFRDDGTQLFSEPNISMTPSVMILFGHAKPFPTIFNSPQGTKMMLVRFTGTVRVYSLPGNYYEITQLDDFTQVESVPMIDLRPNPADEKMEVLLNVPSGFKNPVLHIYSGAGNSIMETSVNPQQRSVMVNTSIFSQGVYFLKIIAENGASKTLKFIKK